MKKGSGAAILQIAKRELNAYFVSPIAYVSAAVFLAVFGAMFALILYFSREATLRYVFDHGVALLFFVLITQVITMRLLADESRQGTLELLLTAPVRDWEIVLGKYLAALALLALMLVLAGYFAVVLLLIGNPDVGPMLTGYLGYFLLGAALLAVGEFASSVTESQLVAALLGLGITLMLWLLGAAAEIVGGAVGEFLAYLPIFDHAWDMLRGIVDTKNVIYLISVVAVFLFMTTRVLESKRWA